MRCYADNSAFKLYMVDQGLLARMMNAAPNELLLEENTFVEFKGLLAGNYVLQQMKPELDTDGTYYFSMDNPTQEIDFFVEKDGRVFLIEVKTEVYVESKSLSGFINNDHADKGLKGIRFSLLPYLDQQWMENMWGVVEL